MKHKKARNLRKKTAHASKYGMDRREWAKFKREHPKEAHKIYMERGGHAK